MSRSPIDPHIRTGEDEPREEARGVEPDTFREALSQWPTGVSVVATVDPDGGAVHATTVGSLGGVSADPPRIVLSLGAGAQVLPFLEEGSRFVVNVLSVDQNWIAQVYTDAFPVGPSPFAERGDPIIEGAHAHLVCSAESIVPVGSSRLVVGLVEDARVDPSGGPLIYYRRSYRSLDPSDPER